MKNLMLALCLSLVLSLAACGTPIPINPTAIATAPPEVGTAVSGAATAAASVTVPSQVGTAISQFTPPPVTAHALTPLPPEAATAVITTYARHQLGIDVEVLKAFGVEGELDLPASTQANVRAALDLAGTSYGALLKGGLGIVALGGATVSGDVAADIDWASLGVFTLRSESPYPANPDAALALIKQTYPGIAQNDFTPRTVERGFGFSSVTSVSAVDPSTGTTQTVGKVIISGVIQSEQGLVLVYVIVGNGSLSQPLAP